MNWKINWKLVIDNWKLIMKYQQIYNRLRRIEGQIRGVEQMVEKDRSAEDILIQLEAAKSSLGSAIGSLVDFMLESNVDGDVKINAAQKRSFLRLIKKSWSIFIINLCYNGIERDFLIINIGFRGQTVKTDSKNGEKIVVDQDLCIGCGTCVGIAPDYFKLNDEGKSHVIKKYDEKDKDKIEDAIDSCPANAITLNWNYLADHSRW